MIRRSGHDHAIELAGPARSAGIVEQSGAVAADLAGGDGKPTRKVAADEQATELTRVAAGYEIKTGGAGPADGEVRHH